jgi:hypothetical protein
MTNGQLDEYLRNRFSKARDYYDTRATANQACYRICALYLLMASVALSLLLSLDIAFGGAYQIVALVLAPTIAVVAGVANHFRFHENWLSYRAAWERCSESSSYTSPQRVPTSRQMVETLCSWSERSRSWRAREPGGLPGSLAWSMNRGRAGVARTLRNLPEARIRTPESTTPNQRPRTGPSR